MARTPKQAPIRPAEDAIVLADKVSLPLAKRIIAALRQRRAKLALTLVDASPPFQWERIPPDALPVFVIDPQRNRFQPGFMTGLGFILATARAPHYLVLTRGHLPFSLPGTPKIIDLGRTEVELRPRELSEILSAITNYVRDRSESYEPTAVKAPPPKPIMNPAYLTNVDDLGLPNDVARALYLDNVIYVGDVVQKTSAELLALDGMTERGLAALEVALGQVGLKWGIEAVGWPPDNIQEALERLEIERRPVPVDPIFYRRLSGLAFSVRTANSLLNNGTIFLGDLVQLSEYEILRVPNLGRKSLHEIKEKLASFSLRLGMVLERWPPPHLEETVARLDAADVVRRLEQSNTGATFEPRDGHLAINPAGDDDDVAAAEKPVTRQLHEAIRKKAAPFAELAHRLGNQPSWTGLHSATVELARVLDRPTEAIPDELGTLYSAALELGSFLDLDAKLRAGQDGSSPPLDADIRRPLEDLVRTLAPWLRSFPTVRQMDDDTGKFLIRQSELPAAERVIHSAKAADLITKPDAQAVLVLAEAGRGEGFQADKARTRTHQTARNLVFETLRLTGALYLGAIGSDFALHSIVAQKASAFLSAGEHEILELVDGLPQDLRLSIELILRESRALGEGLPASFTEAEVEPQVPDSPIQHQRHT